MKVYGRKHIFRYVPNFLDNRRLPKERIADQIVIRLRGVSVPEEDAYQREALNNVRTFAPDKAQEMNEARLHKLFNEKFDGVEGLEIDDLAGKEMDFDTFYAEAPTDIVNEVLRAIRSTEALMAGEQKNFLPESDGV
ncbi:MAG: hypothetical protein A2Y38_26345 [Spirochaetes bacterium GWB1_59_5]|nr:MAG: hypothetical protein A2Y38_26345 [Spirochaetes bacterium GWB1_59_5]